MLDHLTKNNHRHGTTMFNEKLREAVIRVMEDEEKDAEHNANNVTTDTFVSVASHCKCTKERCKRDILETN